MSNLVDLSKRMAMQEGLMRSHAEAMQTWVKSVEARLDAFESRIHAVEIEVARMGGAAGVSNDAVAKIVEAAREAIASGGRVE